MCVSASEPSLFDYAHNYDPSEGSLDLSIYLDIKMVVYRLTPQSKVESFIYPSCPSP